MKPRNSRCVARFTGALRWIPIVIITPVAQGHHSFAAMYHEDQEVRIEAYVIQFVYKNPHSMLQLRATDEDGAEQRWAVEWAGTLDLNKSGVKKNVLQPGVKVIVVGAPSRNKNDHRLRLKSIERLSDGWRWEWRQP